MDKHEYMIWRATTRYNLLHDENLGATEENMTEMINERERKIIELIPNYFEGKSHIGYGEPPIVYTNGNTKLKFTISFISTKDDYAKWEKSELLCAFGKCDQHHTKDYKKYRMVSYDEALKFVLEFDYKHRLAVGSQKHLLPDRKNPESINKWLGVFHFLTLKQAINISLAYDCSEQITPNGEEVYVCTFVGEDCLEKRGDRNE